MKHVLIIAIMIFSSVVNAQVVTIEAENMSIKQCANGKATTDGWTCLGPGKIAENVTFKDGVIDMQVIAQGDYAGGAWPIMDVSIGGTVIAAITVDSATWKTFNIEKVTTSAGVHELALTFTNDYYEAPDDRNLHMDKVIIQNTGFIGSVTVAWDANTEPNIAGYIINYGKVSRYDPAVIAGIPDAIKKGCNLPESGELTESQQSCKKSWEDYCKCNVWAYNEEEPPVLYCKKVPDPPDLACDYDYYPYETSVDVKNVLEYTIEGLTEGINYIAATAYDQDPVSSNSNESKYSNELTHIVHKSTQGGKPINLRWIPKETNNK
jgi:hypothetical protein